MGIDIQYVQEGLAEIRVAFLQNDINWSAVGTLATNIPMDVPTMNLGAINILRMIERLRTRSSTNSDMLCACCM